jgi:predicted DNA-binding protein with PD1-like motif
MKAKLLNEQNGRTFALIFDKGDEIIATLSSFAKDQSLTASHFTAIGTVSDAQLGYFDREKKEYRRFTVSEQVEVLALVGNISRNQGEPRVHAHITLGRSDGTTRGGHLFAAHIWPTLELFLTESPTMLQCQTDEESGLALINL